MPQNGRRQAPGCFVGMNGSITAHWVWDNQNRSGIITPGPIAFWETNPTRSGYAKRYRGWLSTRPRSSAKRIQGTSKGPHSNYECDWLSEGSTNSVVLGAIV